MGKEQLRLSPGNQNVLRERLSKGTNPSYAKLHTSLVALRGAQKQIPIQLETTTTAPSHHEPQIKWEIPAP